MSSPEATAYQIIHSIDPMRGGRIPIGAMLIIDRQVVYIARSKIPKTLRPALRAALTHRRDRLLAQAHPWEIGAEVVAEGRWYFVPASFGDPKEWVSKLLGEDMFSRGEP